MSVLKDLTGQTFGRLTVVEFAGINNQRTSRWKCKCICGNFVTVSIGNLRNGNTKSCGCFSKESREKARFIDITGKKFGRLTVVKREGYCKNSQLISWLCQCDCGKQVNVAGGHLKSGHTQSCGCFALEQRSERNLLHGMSKTRLHNTWTNMLVRCNDSKDRYYKNYGGRGITVCEEWEEFIPFRDWALLNGYCDNLTIERKDVNGNYCPDNCAWATQKQQQNNKTNNHNITYNNKTQTLSQWAEELNINYDVLERRLNKGNWSVEKAFTTPVKKRIV